jgi:hypothetical protein
VLNKYSITFLIFLLIVSTALSGNIREHHMTTIGPEETAQWEQQLAASAVQPVSSPEALAEEVGRTWYDYATNNQMGRMLNHSANGIHFAFMKRQPDQNGTRYVAYNYLDTGLGFLLGDIEVTTAQATGWGRVINGQNDEALVVMHGGAIWLWQDAMEAGYSFNTVLSITDPLGPVFPGIARQGDNVVFLGQLDNANWTGGDTILVSRDYMASWTGYNIFPEEPQVTDYGPGEMWPTFDPTDATGNTWRVVYGPPNKTATPNGSINLATTTDFGASFTTEMIWDDDSVVVQGSNEAQYIIENFNQLNSMYTQDGVYHIVFGAVQGIIDTTTSTAIDMFPILYWNDRDRQMIELTTPEISRPVNPGVKDTLADYRPGNGIGNAYPILSEGPNPGEVVCVWQQWEDDGSGHPVMCAQASGGNSTNGVFATDIWGSYSSDGGATWSTPFFVAGTPAESDVYPNLPDQFLWNATLDSIYLDVLWMDDVNGGVSLTNFGYYTEFNEAIWMYDRVAIPQFVNSIGDDDNLVSRYSLAQNYPNPFNPTTTISFEIQKTENVMIEVFNTLGEKVATVLNDRMTAGPHEITFDASNLASGVYVYRMTAGDVNFSKKMMLLK